MKVLVYGINFSPELTGIGKYTGEMATWLASHGHEVRVVTAPPYYPAWTVSAGYRASAWSVEKIMGVHVWRCPLWVPAKPGGTSRVLHLASFALSSLPIMFLQIFWRPDVVWVVEPALFCAPCAVAVARLSGAKAWLHIQDFEVNAAFGLGMLRGKRIRALVERCERWLMRRFDVVSTISSRMMDLLLAKGVLERNAFLAPNWVDISAISPKTEFAGANPFRLQLGLSTDCVVALYSGNMGAKQGLEILAEVARLHETGHTKSDGSSLAFVFCGDGAGKSALQLACVGLANVHFLPLQPLDQLNELLAMADIHLLPQRADAADLVMPSKLTGILASGKPVVATAHAGTELARVVAGSGHETQCGMVVPPENAAAMLAAIEVLLNDVVLRHRLGVAARAYAEQNLHIEEVLAKFAARL